MWARAGISSPSSADTGNWIVDVTFYISQTPPHWVGISIIWPSGGILHHHFTQ